MKSSAYLVALKIAQILEEHQESEIRTAVKILEDAGHSSSLFDHLFGRRGSVRESSNRTTSVKAAGQSDFENSISRFVLKLRDSEPEKYRLLSEFERMIKTNQVLNSHESLKRFGEQVSKEFEPKKSRKESIGPLIKLLSSRSLEEIRRLIEAAASFEAEGATDNYQRLAQFLISGKKPEV